MPDFNRVKPFRFWCQKVLPLVYDDSLSYYELLNKVVDYLNRTIEDVNSVIQLTEDFTEEQAEAYAEFTADIEQTVDTLTNSFNTLHDFVDNYFDNLDVQEEIDNKLDEMAIDGTLYNMFAPIAEDAIPTLVTQWLNEHITPTSPPVDKTLTVSNAAADAKVVGTNFDDLKQRMSLEEEWEIPITFEDLIQGGYNSDGSVNADGTNYLRTPQMIPIYPGMSMHFKGGAVIDRMKAGYFDPVTRRYDASKDIAWFTGERTVTFDMYGLIIPLFRRASNTEVIPTDFDAEFELISETKTRIETRVLYKNSGETANGDIGSGTELECGYSIQPRKNLVITFSGKIPTGSTFANLEIGLKSGSTKYNNLVIDSQNVTFTTMVNTVVTKPHGLTITKNIQVSIKTILENKAIVRITSNGSSVDLEFTPYQQWRIASAYAETSGSLTLCTLSCINQDIAKPIWYFGDSYTAYASNRWPYYADKWVNNILLDGYGGETSNYVITAFETYLTSGYPQYAVFATGMNDGSDTDVNTPNADWLSAVEVFIEICEDNQIIPILCTVPTTPVYNNNGKNVYVRTSGYWYIDFANAVGADGTGAWYAGMLGTDNIHPTVAGAKALCAQIEADFPEVFIQGVETDKSLSRYGVAADAGETGERFDEVDEEIDGLKEDLNTIGAAFEETLIDITPNTEIAGHYMANSGEIQESASTNYKALVIDSILVNVELLISGSKWYSVNPYVFIGNTIQYPSLPASTTPVQYTDLSFTPTETGILYINRYESAGNIQVAAVYKDVLTGSIKYEALPVDDIEAGMTDALSYTPVDVGELITPKILNGSTGEITDGSNNIQRVTDYLPVDPNTYYIVTTETNYGRGLYAWYDASKTFISGANADAGSSYTHLYGARIKSPVNAAYIVVALIYQNPYPFISLMKGSMNSITPSKRWNGKKWALIGDSITAAYTPTGIHYFELISAATGITWENHAVSGCGYAKGTGGNFMSQALAVSADADVVTFFGSGNDASAGRPLGTATDTGTSTVAGCINTAIDNLYTIIPLAQIGIITPTPWKNNMPYDNAWMESYANLIVAICKLRSIPCLDLYHESNIDTNSEAVRNIAYSRDDGNATHLNEIGHRHIAPRIQAFLDTLLMH